MDPTFIAQYFGFIFHCSPIRLGSGKFGPQLVVQFDQMDGAIQFSIALEQIALDTPTQAARAAFALGRKWVDNEFRETEEMRLIGVASSQGS